MSRFMIAWCMLSSMLLVYWYNIFPKKEKVSFLKVTIKAVLIMLTGLIILFGIMSLNHLPSI